MTTSGQNTPRKRLEAIFRARKARGEVILVEKKAAIRKVSVKTFIELLDEKLKDMKDGEALAVAIHIRIIGEDGQVRE